MGKKLMKGAYKTISGSSRGLYKEKGSKFYAFAFPVHSEREIKERLNSLREQYHDARHHCYAYRLGPDGSKYRIHDDGEPAHTGGKPILGQIDKYELTMILVVVVRYFGGTLLGASGLARAYKAAAANALSNAKTKHKYLTRSIKIEFEYAQINEIMRLADQPGIDIREQDFAGKCFMMLRVKQDLVEGIVEQLKRLKVSRYEVD